MTKSLKIVAAAAVALTISACSGNDAPDGGETTETRMDDIDVIDGTISDDMVDVDTTKEIDATGAEDETKSEEEKESASADDKEKESAEKPAE